MTNIFIPEGLNDLAEGWYVHVKKEQRKHALSASRNEYLNARIGYPAAAIQAVVAMSVFGTFMEGANYPAWVRWLAIGLATTSAVLVAMQTKGDYAREAEKHRMAASRLKNIIQEFELLLLDVRQSTPRPGSDPQAGGDVPEGLKDRLNTLRERYQRVESESPQTFLPGIAERVDAEDLKIIRDFVPERNGKAAQ